MAEGGGRLAFSWLEFNEWAREVQESTGKRPGVAAINEWWNANAERIWPNSPLRPTLEDARRHAKGLRSKAAIRVYFRDYRARRKMGADGRRLGTRKAKSPGRRADNSEDKHGDEDAAFGDEPLDGANKCSDDEQNLIKQPQGIRPQRSRRTPARYQTAAATETPAGPDNSSSSGSLGSGGDGGDSEGEQQDQQQPRPTGPLYFIADATTLRNQQPVPLAKRVAGPSKALPPEGPWLVPEHAAAALGAAVDNSVDLLQYLTNEGAAPLQMFTTCQAAMHPEVQHLRRVQPGNPHSSVQSARNVDEGLAQLGAMHAVASLQSLPRPGANPLPAMECMYSEHAHSGAMAAAPLSASQLWRPLSSVQLGNVLPAADSANAYAFWPGMEMAQPAAAGCVNGVRFPAVRRPDADECSQLRENHKALKRAVPAGGHQPPRKKCVDVRSENSGVGEAYKTANPSDLPSFNRASSGQAPLLGASRTLTRTAANPAPVRRTSPGASVLANASTPFSQRMSPKVGHDGAASVADGADVADAEPPSATRLTSSLGSAFKAYPAPDLGLDQARQAFLASAVDSGAAALADSNAAAARGRIGGRRSSVAAAAGEWDDGLFGSEVLMGQLAMPQQQAALIHLKQEAGGSTEQGAAWVPVGFSSGSTYGGGHGESYGGSDAAGSTWELPYASGPPFLRQLQHSVHALPPLDQQHMAYPTIPNAAWGATVLMPVAGKAWQVAESSGGMFVGAPGLSAYGADRGYGAISGYTAAMGGYGLYGSHTPWVGYGACGGYWPVVGSNAYSGYEAEEGGTAASRRQSVAEGYGYAAKGYGALGGFAEEAAYEMLSGHAEGILQAPPGTVEPERPQRAAVALYR